MNKKTMNIFLSIADMALICFAVISICGIVRSIIYFDFNVMAISTDPHTYTTVAKMYGGVKELLLWLFATLFSVASVVFITLFLVKGNKEEIKSVAIDFSARRAEKKRAKTEAKKERLKAELEELENDEKRTLD